MKKNLLIIGAIAATFSMNAQTTFTTQTSGTTQSLKGVSFLPNSTEGWAVGSGGTILNTTDGESWNPQTSGVTATLEDITLIHTLAGITFGWACGSSGTILGTEDAGATWEIQSEGAPVALYSVDFQDISNGFVVGSTANVSTTNGGNFWNPIMTSTTLNAVDFVTTSIGYACGNSGTILKTTDGGANWTSQTSGTVHNLFGIHFLTETEGWATGISGTILHTTDGGTNWSAQTSNTGNLIYEIEFIDAMNGWAVGYSGSILHTTNGGDTWTFYHSGLTGTVAELTSLSLKSATEGWAVGSTGTIVHFSSEDETSSLNELNATEQLKLYPNPATNVLSIQNENEIESIAIYTMSGQLVQHEENTTFSVEQLAKGIYTVMVKTVNDVQIAKFIKE